MSANAYEREEIAHMCKVMQAYANGQKIQWRAKADHAPGEWGDCDPCWDWSSCEYRIKPAATRVYAVCDWGLANGWIGGVFMTPEDAGKAFRLDQVLWHGWMVREGVE